MWGVRGGAIKNIRGLIDEYQKGNFWQVDQNFLNAIIYPQLKDDAFIHDEYQNYELNKNNFPSPRHGRDFVGQRVSEFEERE
jgi:hypothetical protein